MVLPKKRVSVAKHSDMGGGGQGSKGQRPTVNGHICQEIFSVFTSSSGVLSYKGLWYSGNANIEHMQLVGIRTKT